MSNVCGICRLINRYKQTCSKSPEKTEKLGEPIENTFAASCGGASRRAHCPRPSEGVCDWSALRGSNSRHSAWEADTLPTELNAHISNRILFHVQTTVNKSGSHQDPGILAELDEVVTHLMTENDLTLIILQLIRNPELLI